MNSVGGAVLGVRGVGQGMVPEDVGAGSRKEQAQYTPFEGDKVAVAKTLVWCRGFDPVASATGIQQPVGTVLVADHGDVVDALVAVRELH